MPEQLAFIRSHEYAKDVSIQLVTESKIYKEDQLPEGFGGAYIKVEVVHQVFLCDSNGRFTIHKFDIDEALDENDETGGPVLLTLEDDSTVVTLVVGDDMKPPTEISRRLNPNFPSEVQDVADQVWIVYTNEVGEVIASE